MNVNRVHNYLILLIITIWKLHYILHTYTLINNTLSDNTLNTAHSCACFLPSPTCHAVPIWERPAETGHRARAVPFSKKKKPRTDIDRFFPALSNGAIVFIAKRFLPDENTSWILKAIFLKVYHVFFFEINYTIGKYNS